METLENVETMEMIRNLKEENDSLKKELLAWKEYTRKILRLINVFRNEHVFAQAKCIQGIENQEDEQSAGFREFLRGKLHTITEIINDFHIINSIKFIDDDVTNYEEGQEEEKGGKNEPLVVLTEKEIEERKNGKIINFFGVDYTMS